MSPYAFYQFWINRSDAEVPGLLRVFTFRSRDEIQELERQTAEQPAARIGQRVLAEDLTTLVHGAARSYARAVAASRALFGQGDLRALDAKTLAAALAEVPLARLPAPGDALPPVADLMAEAGIVAEQVGGPAGHRRGRRLPEQHQGDRPGFGSAGERPAARQVPGAAAGQAHGRRYRGPDRLRAAPASAPPPAAGLSPLVSWLRPLPLALLAPASSVRLPPRTPIRGRDWACPRTGLCGRLRPTAAHWALL